jgi:hypothetical protein
MLAFQASGFVNASAFVKTTTRHVDKTSRRAGRVERLCNFGFWTRRRPIGLDCDADSILIFNYGDFS